MVTIHAQKQPTDFSDVLQWQVEEGERVEFVVGKESRFMTLAEGIAIGRLQDLRASQARIAVRLTFPVNIGQGYSEIWTVIAGIPMLCSPFGLALLLASEEVKDSNGTSIRDGLLAAFWQQTQLRNGLIGDGKRLSVIAREPSAPLPSCLVERSENDFPTPSKFKKLLESMGSQLGGGQSLTFSIAEQGISTFLYEATRNSWEHGRENEAGEVLPGARGIIVEKLIIHNAADLASRRDVPSFVRRYLERVHEDRGEGQMFALAVTVADYGPGIHRTLPGRAGESDWNRLLRAFETGSSCKPSASDLSWGQGLPNIVDVCKPPLKGFLFVRSAELSGCADFSLPSEADTSLLIPLTNVAPSGCGTSLSILWVLAAPGYDHDQQMLF